MSKTYLNKTRMHIIYSCYLESSDTCGFSLWLDRHEDLSSYQKKRMLRFEKSDYAKSILHSHAWD